MYEQRFNPFAANVAVVKGYFKGGKVLALGILHLVSLCLSVLTLLTRPLTSSLNSTLAQLENLGVDTSDLYRYYPDSSVMESSMTASAIATVIVSSAITILTVVAFIVIFVKSRSTDPNANPKAGVGILHVLAVIAFVCSIILTVIVGIAFLIIALAGGIATGYSDDIDSGAMIAVMLIVGILFAALMFFMIFTAAAQKNFYRSVKHSLTSVQLQNKGAKAYGVLNIIFAVFSGLSLIGTVISTVTGPLSLSAFLPFASAAVSFAVLILNAFLALGYARYINGYKYGYNIPAAPDAYIPADVSGQNPYAQAAQDSYQSYSMPQQPAAYNDSFTSYKPAENRPAFCPKCGAPTDPAAPFCSNCGNKL